MLKADAHDALGELQARLEDSADSLEDAFVEEDTAEAAQEGSNDGPVGEMKEILEAVGQYSNGTNGTNGSGNNGAATIPLESTSSGEHQAATGSASSKPRARASRAKAT